MIIFEKKDKITFDWIDVLNFWLIEFALIETNKTPKDELVGWVKNDLEKYLYKYLCIAILIIVTKYSIMKIRMP